MTAHMCLDVKEVVRLYREGLSLEEIAQRVGALRHSILKLLTRHGVRQKSELVLKYPSDPAVIAYVAGLFDGEGCINISTRLDKRRHGKNATLPEYVLRTTIANTNLAALEYVEFQFGGSIWRESKREKKCKKLYTWHASGPAASNLLKILLPYLIIKKEEALVAIEFQSHKIMKRGQLTEVEMSVRQMYKDKLHQLKRGTESCAGLV